MSLPWREQLATFGYYAVHYSLVPRNEISLLELKEIVRTDTPRYTGWPPFWWPTREEIEPKVIDENTYECLHDGTGVTSTIERWRASRLGDFVAIRPHDHDDENPGEFLNLVLPVWRISELLLHAGRMAEQFGSESIDFTVKFSGLKGRTLTTKHISNRFLSRDYSTEATAYEKRLVLESAELSVTVVEVTNRLLTDLYQLFQFELPPTLCEEEITRMIQNRL